MAKIYFNRPIIKHLEETTVINFFLQKDKASDNILVRDTRKDVYRDNYVVFGDIDVYKNIAKKGEWYCDIVDMKVPDYTVFGFYVGEGVDFEVIASKDPVFLIRQKNTEMSLATVDYMPQGTEVPEVALGLFHVGSKIKYKRNGVQVLDELTNKGWVRRQGPSDNQFGIITIEEAFQKKLKREEMMKDPKVRDEIVKESIQRIRDAKGKHDIGVEFADSLIDYKLGKNQGVTYFLASDMKNLKEKGIII